MKNLVVDLNNITFITRYGALKGQKGTDHVMEFIAIETISSILKAAKTLQVDGIVIACDSKKVWRKDLYPMYKEGRDTKADKYYEHTIEAIGKVKEFFDDYTAAMVLSVDRAEADDIIAVWCAISDCESVILSSDKDFVQLISDKVSLYNPMKKELRTSDDPAFDLFVKCIRGDSSDAIRSAYPRVKTTALEEAWKDEYKMVNLMETIRKDGKKVADAYKFNKSLIDMDLIPDWVIVEIDKVIHGYDGNDSYSELKAVGFLGDMGFKNTGSVLDYKDHALKNRPALECDK